MDPAQRRFGYFLMTPALALILLFLVLPIVLSVITSLYVDNPFTPRRFVGLANYARLLGDGVARGTLGFTFLFVGASVLLELAAGIALALVMHQALRARGLVRAAILIPWAIPTVVTAVMWKYMCNDQYGLFNLILHGERIELYRAWLAEPGTARLAIILADVWKTAPFVGLLVLAGLQAIPGELYEAARVDGAGPVRRFFAITLPLLRPAILLALLFRTMDALRVFDLVYVMTQGAPGDATNVLQFYGYQKIFPEQQFGYGAAVSVVVFVIIGVLGLLTVRAAGTRLFAREGRGDA
jgi:multiple sugar transport system permease protein